MIEELRKLQEEEEQRIVVPLLKHLKFYFFSASSMFLRGSFLARVIIL